MLQFFNRHFIFIYFFIFKVTTKILESICNLYYSQKYFFQFKRIFLAELLPKYFNKLKDIYFCFSLWQQKNTNWTIMPSLFSAVVSTVILESVYVLHYTFRNISFNSRKYSWHHCYRSISVNWRVSKFFLCQDRKYLSIGENVVLFLL